MIASTPTSRLSRRLAAAALLPAVLGAVACGRYLRTSAVVVNGVGIGQDVFDARMQAVLANPQLSGQFQGDAGRLQLARQVISELVQQEMVRQEARRRGIEVTATRIDSELEAIRKQFPSEEALREAMARERLTEATLRERIAERLTFVGLQETLGGSASDAEVKAHYRRNRAQFEEVRARHILFRPESATADAAALAEARAALREIRSGADFAAVARRLSDDTSTKDKGGDLGYQPRVRSDGQPSYVPEFERVAFGAAIGAVSEPVRSQYGYHLVQVLDRRMQPLARVREQIRSRLDEDRRERAFAEWYRSALADAAIVVNPRYGDWEPRSGQVVEREFFLEPTPAATDAP